PGTLARHSGVRGRLTTPDPQDLTIPPYQVGGKYYPLQLRNQMSTSDVPLFSADVELMFQGFQISRSR
ncbi:hypothetical protein DDJ92_00005, partial [Mycobacteroides abscessus]